MYPRKYPFAYPSCNCTQKPKRTMFILGVPGTYFAIPGPYPVLVQHDYRSTCASETLPNTNSIKLIQHNHRTTTAISKHQNKHHKTITAPTHDIIMFTTNITTTQEPSLATPPLLEKPSTIAASFS